MLGTRQPTLVSSLDGASGIDVCIVGAGIAGLSVAWHCLKDGKSVLVLDAGDGHDNQTLRTSAHLSSVLDRRYEAISRVRGETEAGLAAESHGAAIDRVEAIVTELGINCWFERVDGYLFAPPGGSLDELRSEQDAARRAGLAVDLIARAPLASYDTGPCLRFPRQGHFDPMPYLAELGRAIVERGGRIVGNTPVESVNGGARPSVKLRDGTTIEAGSVVVATNTPNNDWVSDHLLQAAWRTYVVGGFVAPDT